MQPQLAEECRCSGRSIERQSAVLSNRSYTPHSLAHYETMATADNFQRDDGFPEWLQKQVLVLGCGNRLFGDDGFGPAVIEYLLKNYQVPAEVCALDVGTGVRKILFTITLSETRPEQVVIVDAVDLGRKPGELFELAIADLPENKLDDFSMHQLPTSNLLRELKRLGSVNVRVLACQSGLIPEEVKPGLSEVVQAAIPGMCALIMNLPRKSGSQGFPV